MVPSELFDEIISFEVSLICVDYDWMILRIGQDSVLGIGHDSWINYEMLLRFLQCRSSIREN